MTDYQVLKDQAKRTLPEVTRFSIRKLRSTLGFCSTTTAKDCEKIMQELHPLTKRQKEVLIGFGNGWHYVGDICTYKNIVLKLNKKGYLRSNSAKDEFKRILPI